MKITAFDGSPRTNGNSSTLLRAFLEGVGENADIELVKTDALDLKACRGCLMCNTMKRCALRKDDWQRLSQRILESDVLVFASPIYFHHTTASMKRMIDRFRSFIHVKITPGGITHTPHEVWEKKFYLLTAHGSSSVDDAIPLVDLFKFMTESLGSANEFRYLNTVRLAVSGQISYEQKRLSDLYKKLGIPPELAAEDVVKNLEYIKQAEKMGKSIINYKKKYN